MNKVLLFLVVLTTTATVFSQNRSTKSNQHNDFWESIRTRRIAVFTQTIGLTPAEAQQFWPVYNAFDKERTVLIRKRRSLDEKLDDVKSGSPEAEYRKITTDYVSTHMQEARLMENYNNQYLKILPAEKVCKLYQAEKKFRIYLIQELKKNRQNVE